MTAYLFFALIMTAVIALTAFILKLTQGRIRAGWQAAVWCVIFLRLLLPPSLFDVGFRLPEAENVPSQPTVNQAAADQMPVTSAPDTATPQFPAILGTTVQESAENAAIPEIPTEAAPASDPQSEAVSPLSKIDLPSLLRVLWIGGSIAYGVSMLASHMIFSRRLCRSRSLADDEVTALYRELCAEKTIKRAPLLYVSHMTRTPLLCGILRPTIYITPDLPHEAMNAVLSHELAHYSRGDIMTKLLILAARIFWFWHPAVHAAARECELAMELACDEIVLDGKSEKERSDYGMILVGLLRNGRNSGVLILNSNLTTHFHSSVDMLKTRFGGIMNMKKRKRGIAILVAVLALVLVSGSIVGCAAGEPIDEDLNDQNLADLQDEVYRQKLKEEAQMNAALRSQLNEEAQINAALKEQLSALQEQANQLREELKKGHLSDNIIPLGTGVPYGLPSVENITFLPGGYVKNNSLALSGGVVEVYTDPYGGSDMYLTYTPESGSLTVFKRIECGFGNTDTSLIRIENLLGYEAFSVGYDTDNIKNTASFFILMGDQVHLIADYGHHRLHDADMDGSYEIFYWDYDSNCSITDIRDHNMISFDLKQALINTFPKEEFFGLAYRAEENLFYLTTKRDMQDDGSYMQVERTFAYAEFCLIPVSEKASAIAGDQGELSSIFTNVPLTWPLEQSHTTVNLPYGWMTNNNASYFHTGIDLAAGLEEKIFASGGGKVTTAEYHPSYGNYIVIDHGGGISTGYAHCSELLVKGGDDVKAGDVIALVGRTGDAAGEHLHFEIRANGSQIDPLAFEGLSLPAGVTRTEASDRIVTPDIIFPSNSEVWELSYVSEGNRLVLRGTNGSIWYYGNYYGTPALRTNCIRFSQKPDRDDLELYILSDDLAVITHKPEEHREISSIIDLHSGYVVGVRDIDADRIVSSLELTERVDLSAGYEIDCIVTRQDSVTWRIEDLLTTADGMAILYDHPSLIRTDRYSQNADGSQRPPSLRHMMGEFSPSKDCIYASAYTNNCRLQLIYLPEAENSYDGINDGWYLHNLDTNTFEYVTEEIQRAKWEQNGSFTLIE